MRQAKNCYLCLVSPPVDCASLAFKAPCPQVNIEWMQKNDVVKNLLRANLHQKQYVDQVSYIAPLASALVYAIVPFAQGFHAVVGWKVASNGDRIQHLCIVHSKS